MKGQRIGYNGRGSFRRSLLLGGLALGIAVAPASGQILFDNMSATLGLDVDEYQTRHLHGLGVNWIDFNGDGWPDLFATNGKFNDAHLFENDQNGGFIRRDELLPTLPNVEKMGAVFGDVDNDGDQDIYIFTDNHVLGEGNPPDGPLNLLLENQWVDNGGMALPGEPLFVEVAQAAGVADEADPPHGPLPGYRSTTGGFLDYDRDGSLDLYVGHWQTQFGGSSTNKNRLYHNNGDGTFVDVTDAAGLPPATDSLRMRPTLAFLAAHLNGDLWPDLYVVNVQMPSPHHHDIYWRNLGDGTFFDATAQSLGIGDDSGAGMGIDTADIDLDGDFDLYISDLFDPGNDSAPLGNPLYLNNGDGTFSDNSAPAAGVMSGNSWAINFFDADLDGDEELFVGRMGDTVANNLYVNDGTGQFVDEAVAAGIGFSGNARGAATADYDRDGLVDIAIIHQRGELGLYRNVSLVPGHWLQIALSGDRSNGDAIGAIVRIEAGGNEQLRQVIGGSSAHSQDELAVHFGLGSATTVDLIEVTWPSGEVNTYTGIAADQRVELTERFVSTPGIYEPGTDRFSGRHDLASGTEQFGADLGFGGSPIVGDWDGDTVDTPGVYDAATGVFHLWNSYAGGAPDVTVAVSPVPVAGLPIAGDWNGDGFDTVGTLEPGSGEFWLWDTLAGGAADNTFPVTPFGADRFPVAGDWDGDGVDTVGLFDQAAARFYLRNLNERQAWDLSFRFVPRGPAYLPVAGDWDHDGTDEIGVFRPDNGRYELKLDLTDGPGDIKFRFQGATIDAVPVVGAWDRLQ